MIEAARGRFTIYRGAKHVLRFTLTTNGSISGRTYRFYARTSSPAADLALDVAGSIVDNGTADTPGVIEVTLTEAMTLALEKRQYAVALARTDANVGYPLFKDVMDVEYDVRHAA